MENTRLRYPEAKPVKVSREGIQAIENRTGHPKALLKKVEEEVNRF